MKQVISFLTIVGFIFLGMFPSYGFEEVGKVIDFRLINGLIIINGEVDNEVGYYVFDSGADETILNKPGIKSEASQVFITLGGEIKAFKSQASEINIGGFNRKKMDVYVSDLSSISEFVGVPIAGIIGGEMFVPYGIELNYQESQLTITDSNVEPLSHSIPFSFDHGVPIIEIEIFGKKKPFIVDTGATSHFICVSMTNAKIESKVADLVTAGGNTISQSTFSESIILDDVKIINAKWMVSDFDIYRSEGVEVYGIVALSKLGYNKIHIDLNKKLIFF